MKIAKGRAHLRRQPGQRAGQLGLHRRAVHADRRLMRPRVRASPEPPSASLLFKSPGVVRGHKVKLNGRAHLNLAEEERADVLQLELVQLAHAWS